MILFREKMLYLLKVTFIKCISAKYISTCKEDTIFTQGRYNRKTENLCLLHFAGGM